MSERWIKNWFSNMLEMDEPFVEDGIEYKTSENYYQAMKFYPDRELMEWMASLDPKRSKKIARGLGIREDWDDVKLEVMEKILLFKFALGTTWAEKLLRTGDEEIVELNNWQDVYWGYDVNLNKGQNHLGKILMKIRNQLKLEKILN